MKQIFLFSALVLFVFSACKKESPATSSVNKPSEVESPADLPPSPNPEPFSAKFTYSAPDPNNIFEKQTIHLECKASGVVQYVWDLGNGTKLVAKNPDISYLYHGYYPIKLTVTDKDGKTATSTQLVSILCNFGGSH